MAELLQSMIQRVIIGGPDEPPKIPPPKKINPPPLVARPKTPENIPGAKDTTQAATVKDERRRILNAMPKPTEKTYAGELGDAVTKKRVLGGGIGRTKTGE